MVVEGHANINEIGRCGIVPKEAEGLTYQNHLFRLRPCKDSPEFSWIWLNGDFARSYWRNNCRTSSGLNTINQSLLKSMPFPVIDYDEQKRIINFINTLLQNIRIYENKLLKLNQLKIGLMQDLLSGKAPEVPLFEQGV